MHFFFGEPVSGVMCRNWRVSAAQDHVGSLKSSKIQWLGGVASSHPRRLGLQFRLRISRFVCCRAGSYGEILAVTRDDIAVEWDQIAVTWDRIAVRWDHIVVGRDWCSRSREYHGVTQADLARIAGW